MDNLIIGESGSALGAVALVLVMVVFVIPMGYKLWRKYYFGITAANEAAWSEMKASMHNKDATPKPTDTNKTNEDDFDIHTKSLIKNHIKDMDKTKYWTNYFLIFSLIMLAQLIYAVSHLLNQYYGVPNDNGFGVKQDHNAAFEWFKRAADQGDPWGQIAISRGYFKGLGVKQDYAKAIEWAQKGAAQDHAVSQLLLALYYSDDKTGFKDLDKSKKWAETSCRNGNDDACEFILSAF